MCNVCCKEFQGWCRAFTTIEVILSILQAILLALVVAFVTFLILHLIVCADEKHINKVQSNEVTSEPFNPESSEPIQTHKQTSTPSKNNSPASKNLTIYSTVSPNISCTWTPLAKTRADTQYFEDSYIPRDNVKVSTKLEDEVISTVKSKNVLVLDQLDGVPAGNEKTYIMALVKMRPPADIMFGCILTIVSEFWTLTAASCLESIEQIDSLDSFIMMENFGEHKHGKTHTVSDVLIHPQYQGVNKTYDIVALRSEDKLSKKSNFLILPTKLDYLLITIGERLTILGFGKFRSIDKNAFSRGARLVSVHVLPSVHCAARMDTWSSRHLTQGTRLARGRCGAAPICASPLHTQGTCNYCAGTPLLQARVLLGIMSDPGSCGAPCEPSLYVNLAAIKDWLNFVLGIY